MSNIKYNSGVPLYYQIATILREKILSGELSPGDVIPGEETLSLEYEVSRITIRKALADLVTEGFIIRKRGQGTIVREELSYIKPTRFDGSIEALIEQAKSTKVKLLKFESIFPKEDLSKKLCLNKGDMVTKIYKVRYLNDKPFSIIQNYLPQSIGNKINSDDLSEEPLLLILEKKLGIIPNDAIQSVEATVADPEKAKLLDVRVGAPLLMVSRTVYDYEARPIEYILALYRADRYFYSVHLKRYLSNNISEWKPHHHEHEPSIHE